MSLDWYKPATECAIRSYGHRDLLRNQGYRFSLQGLHFGLLPNERGLQAKWRS